MAEGCEERCRAGERNAVKEIYYWPVFIGCLAAVIIWLAIFEIKEVGEMQPEAQKETTSNSSQIYCLMVDRNGLVYSGAPCSSKFKSIHVCVPIKQGKLVTKNAPAGSFLEDDPSCASDAAWVSWVSLP